MDAVSRLEKGSTYTRREISAALGGSPRAALPTRGKRVVCLCVTPERNPGAPAEIVIGPATVPAGLARGLASSRAVLPVFVRQRRNVWLHAGAWRVREAVVDPEAVRSRGAAASRDDAALVLLLEEEPARDADGRARPAG